MKDSKLHGKVIKNLEFPLNCANEQRCDVSVQRVCGIEMFYEGHLPVTYEFMDLSKSTLCSIRAFILFLTP